MTDPQPPERSVPKSEQPKEIPADNPAAGEGAEANKLSADEQMALFEKELKENDWGHQPC